MMSAFDSDFPRYKLYQSVVHKYATNTPVIPLTSHQVYTQNYYDTSTTNVITTYILLILFLSFCYRLIDKSLFQGRLIKSIFGFDQEQVESTVENESEDEELYYFDVLSEKENEEEQENEAEKEKKEEQENEEDKEKEVEKVTLESPDNVDVDWFY
ncbi:hypothetical protein AK88_05569 [Plasmodium fragile]|uniref:Uncharacterized protein n=1 Tax=Plasmodium fragile TaxID=5857 RepID=A0A0D9QD99_PLAFR|nr:uncharacterized protein AK88_05569 [Plasmodium fragile]KJP84797.1 hypothetical protein AK88_05569 [Plasmodium fragile]